MSAELPAAAADPHVVAIEVAQNGEDRLLRAVVTSAQALAVLGAGLAVWPGDAMVFVGARGWSAAAGEHAGAIAGFEEPSQSRREAVAGTGQVTQQRGRRHLLEDRACENRSAKPRARVEHRPTAADGVADGDH